MYDIAIIGGGLSGTPLHVSFPATIQSDMIEKEIEVSLAHQKQWIHSAIHDDIEDIKGKLCLEGISFGMRCQRARIPFERIGEILSGQEQGDLLY